MRVAVVGAGVSGLAAAHELARSGGGSGVRVTVYEKEDSLGGHARTVAVEDAAAGTVHLDLGFMVFNRVTYPNMLEWFEGLGVEMEISDMSFSVSTQLGTSGSRCEWGSRNGISGLLAQKSNAISPSFWCMIREILKFKNDALKYLEDRENNPDLDRNETLGQFIQSHGYSQYFQEAYLIPICACIWSCPSQGVLGFSAFFVLSFCRNHHLLQLFGRPQWLTVKGRSHTYVHKVIEELESMGCQIKTSCEIKSISSSNEGLRVTMFDGSEETYDRVIFGVHAPDALKILGAEATHEELRILGAFQYVYSDIYLHCDKSMMPRSSSAWSSWNFLGTTNKGVCVTYWLNLLQNIESTDRPFLVTLNPPHVPDHVLLKWYTSHPVPSVAAANASLELHHIQGNRGIWYCGAYQGYGFHEDGLKAGKSAAQDLLGKRSGLLVNPKQMVPSWTEAGARLLVARFLGQYISVGNLVLLEEGGTMFSFGEAGKKCHAKSVLRVHDPMFYWKVATEADLGLADAYINGYFSFIDKREGLLNLFLILIANRDANKSNSSGASKSITKTLERYQKSSYGGPDTAIQNKENELVQSSRNEYLKLKARVENLQRTQRNLLGEDLGTLGIKELEQLEKQLDSSLRHIRSTRTQHMLDQLTDLQRKEHMLCEANKCLRRKLEETSSQVHGQQVWEHSANLLGYERQSPQQGPSHVSNGSLHPLEVAPEPTLQIGFAPEHMNNFMPTWLP